MPTLRSLFALALTVPSLQVAFSQVQTLTATYDDIIGSTPIEFTVEHVDCVVPMPHRVEKFALRVSFNTGNDHDLGMADPDALYRFRVVGYANGSIVLDEGPYTLELGVDQPEMVLELDLLFAHSLVEMLEVVREDVPTTGIECSAECQQYVQATFDLTTEFSFEVPVDGYDTYNYLSCFAFPTDMELASLTSDQVRFSWFLNNQCNCTIDHPAYEVQILRLYNRFELPPSDQTIISADPDWSQALSVIVEGANHVDLTLAEGTGYYMWRVRPLSKFYDGGYVNPKNWWRWTTTPASPLDLTRGALPYPDTQSKLWPIATADATIFYYEQFDDDRNWSYSRVFTEASGADGIPVRVGERMTYATDLLQPQQEQVRNSTEGMVIASQSVTDHHGRPALRTLPIPLVDQPSLGYKDELITSGGVNYSAAHFDVPANYDENDPVTTGPSTYYSDANSNTEVPDAETYPFSRTQYLPDGTGRVRQQSGPGDEFAFAVANVAPKTTKTFYAGVSDSELTRVFGLEAYAPKSVSKIVTADANGIVSTTYVDKEGKTLATCLLDTDNDPLDSDTRPLLGITSEDDATDVDYYPISGGTDVGDNTLEATAQIFIQADDTDVDFTYDLLPGQVLDCTGEYCATCDYTVEFFLVNVDCPDANLLHAMDPEVLPPLMEFPPPACTDPVVPIIQRTETVNLDMGSYTFGRRVRVNNIVPNSNPTTTMLEAHENVLELDYYNDMMAEVESLLELLEPTDPADIDLEVFYANSLVQVLNDDSAIIELEHCGDTILLPVLSCEPCEINADKMVQFFIAEYNARALSPAIDPTDPDMDPTFWETYFDYPMCGAGTASQQTWYEETLLDELVNNMQKIDYELCAEVRFEDWTCDELWGCWVGAVYNYLGYLENQALTDPFDPQDIDGVDDLPFDASGLEFPTLHLMELFLDCTGRNIVWQEDWIGGAWNPLDCSDPFPGYLSGAYFAIYEIPQTDPCFMWIDDLSGGVLSGSADCGDIGTFTMEWPDGPYNVCSYWNPPGNPLSPAVNLNEMLSDCIRSGIDPSTGTTLDAAQLATLINEDRADCYLACYSMELLAEFTDQVIAQFPGITSPELECMVTALIADCESTCLAAYPIPPSPPATGSYGPFSEVSDAILIQNGYPVVSECSDPLFEVTNSCTNNPDLCLQWVGELEPASEPDTMGFLTCEESQAQLLADAIRTQIANLIPERVQQFSDDYSETCAGPGSINDLMTAEYAAGKHHYTVYYHDRAGQLMATVPPNSESYQLDGVNTVETDQTLWPTTAVTYPERTTYEYNSQDLLVSQTSPDGGTTLMVYDLIGRLRFSQNAEQRLQIPQVYSYTKYDDLGRVVEVGESFEDNTGNDVIDDPTTALLKAEDLAFPADFTQATHRTLTTYSEPVAGLQLPDGQSQRYLTNRVSTSLSDVDGDESTLHDQVRTSYSYDPHGNVEWLVQDLPGLDRKFVQYTYDLVSGRVLQVRYNPGHIDQYFQRYAYDEDGRILKVETSSDGILWDTDASYDYFAHGPLERMTLGEDKLQGLDHTYTIQGWLKGINQPALSGADVGGDGLTGSTVGRDAFAMMLTYFNGDFERTGSAFNSPSTDERAKHGLYNGNIGAWSWQGQMEGSVIADNDPLAMRYRYDALNRLKADQPRELTGSVWDDDASNIFATAYQYDPNGNLSGTAGLTRNDNTGTAMDAMDYSIGAIDHPNALSTLDESIDGPGADMYASDPHAYDYNAIGQMTQDKWGTPEINISWTPYGKVRTVALESGRHLVFLHNAAGHRVLKADVADPNIDLLSTPTPDDIFTYYVHDAQGNLLATYRRAPVEGVAEEIVDPVYLEEQPIYGSSRLGVRRPQEGFLVQETIWDGAVGAVQPVQLHYKSELDRLDIPSRLTKDNPPNSISVYAHTVDNATSNIDPDIASIAAMPVFHMGVNCANIHRTEDRLGNTVFTAMAVDQVVNGITLDRFYLHDAVGNLIWNSNGIKSANNTTTMACQVPGQPDRYYLFTVGTNGIPYLHIVDMSGAVWTQGAVVAKNIPLDATGGYDRGMALIDDHTSYGHSMLYMRKYTAGHFSLMALDIEQYALNGTGQLQSLHQVTGGLSGRGGLMQVSPDGHWLAMATSDNPQYVFGPYNSKVHFYELSSDHTQATYSHELERDYVIRNLDFSPDGEYLYFVENELDHFNNLVPTLWRYEMSSMVLGTVTDVTSHGGDIRRTKHGEMLLATPAFAYPDEACRVIDPNGGTPTLVWGDFSLANCRAESAEGLQPLMIDLGPAAATRVLGDKRYELTDHLGNVRSVISDRKLCDITPLSDIDPDTDPTDYMAEVVSWSDYYPFGSLLPGRNYSSDSYAHGFNGMRKDDEIHGATGTSYDFGARLYDPRVGRWLSSDPLAAKYPFLSPYQFAGNNPVRFVDFDGNDFGITIDHATKTVVIVATFHTVNEQTQKEAMKAVASWNALSGSTVEIGGVQYTVSVSIDAKMAEGADQGERFLNAQASSNSDPRANTYNGSLNGLMDSEPSELGKTMGRSMTKEERKSGRPHEVGLSDGKNITMPRWNREGDVPLYAPLSIDNSVEHEMGHNFGLDDPGGTYNTPGGAMDYSGPYVPNLDDLKNVIRYALDGSKGRANANLQQYTSAGSDFDPTTLKGSDVK